MFRRTSTQKAVGVRFQADFTATSNVAIHGSRFFGPMSAGIQLEGDIDNLSIRDCIFAEAGVGIRSTGDTPTFRDVRVVNNTFYKLQRGIVFSRMPNEASSGGLHFDRNLFAELTGPEGIVVKGFQLSAFKKMTGNNANVTHNWSSRPAPNKPAAGELNLFVNGGKRGVEGLKFASTKPGSGNFLAPQAPDVKVSASEDAAHPYVGAVAPR